MRVAVAWELEHVGAVRPGVQPNSAPPFVSWRNGPDARALLCGAVMSEAGAAARAQAADTFGPMRSARASGSPSVVQRVERVP